MARAPPVSDGPQSDWQNGTGVDGVPMGEDGGGWWDRKPARFVGKFNGKVSGQREKSCEQRWTADRLVNARAERQVKLLKYKTP